MNRFKKEAILNILIIVVPISLILIFVLLNCSNKNPIKNNLLSGNVSISPNEKQIIFSFYINGIASIYTATTDGSNIKRLTFPDNESHLFPEYSPDGSKILFLSFNEVPKKPRSYLHIMNADGSNIKQLTFDDKHITEAVFSANNTTIYFLKSSSFGHYSPIVSSHPHDFDIYSISIDGSKLGKKTNLSAYDMGSLSISSDGKKLSFRLYEDGKELFCLLSLENTRELVSFDPTGSLSQTDSYDEAKLSPNGKLLAFSAPANRRGTYKYELFIMDIETKKTEQLTKLGNLVTGICFFHKQNKILFLQDLNWPKYPPNYQLMQINSDGSNLAKIDLTIPVTE